MHILTGKVLHGDKRGSIIGFPTINIFCDTDDISDSVFQVNTIIDGRIFQGVGSYQRAKKRFEVHIFDFDAEIYGEEVEIILLQKIRDNQKFENFEELKSQIQKDVDVARNTKIYVLTFGSFDHFHKGHEYYLKQAKKYGTHLVTIIATDENIEKIKGKAPKYTLLERVGALIRAGISHEVIAGNNTDPYKCIQKYKPQVLCLGYDQKGIFVEKLPQKLKELGILSEIIRIPSFEPEKYKSSILKEK